MQTNRHKVEQLLIKAQVFEGCNQDQAQGENHQDESTCHGSHVIFPHQVSHNELHNNNGNGFGCVLPCQAPNKDQAHENRQTDGTSTWSERT